MLDYNQKLNNRQVGSYYEQQARQYLQNKGYKILQMNFRCRTGEIDMIAKDGAYTVFVEVKARSTYKCGWPCESVTVYKRKKIIKTAQYYLICQHLGDIPCRFDVIEIYRGQIHHITNAFMEG